MPPTALVSRLDTALLLKLRFILDENSLLVTTDPVLHKLSEIRLEAKQICSSYNTKTENTDKNTAKILNLARQVWATLSKVDQLTSTSVISKLLPPSPPIYEHDFGLDETINQVIVSLFQREVAEIASAQENTGHIVLGGVEGAGKSTLLTAFAVAAAVLFKKVTPLYWNYTTQHDRTTPVQLLNALTITATTSLHELPRCLSENVNDKEEFGSSSVTNCCDILADNGLLPVLLFDEIQTMFSRDEFTNDRIAIAHQICAVARLGGTFCVLAGTSSKMRSYLFRKYDPKSDHWRDFPDFNGSLFNIRHVSALRTRESLTRYLSMRYTSWELSDQDITSILTNTGGIGRFVHNYYLHCLHNQTKCYIPRRAAPLLYFFETKSFLLLFHLIISTHGDKASTACVGVPYTTVSCALEEVGYSPEVEIESWVDAGMAYIHKTADDDDASVQFAIPADAHNIMEAQKGTASQSFLRSR